MHAGAIHEGEITRVKQDHMGVELSLSQRLPELRRCQEIQFTGYKQGRHRHSLYDTLAGTLGKLQFSADDQDSSGGQHPALAECTEPSSLSIEISRWLSSGMGG